MVGESGILDTFTPKHVHILPAQPSFSSSTYKRSEVRMCKLYVISQERLKIEVKLLLSASRKSYMPCRFAQQRITFCDLEWPFHACFHASRAISAVAKILVLIDFCWLLVAWRQFPVRCCYQITWKTWIIMLVMMLTNDERRKLTLMKMNVNVK